MVGEGEDATRHNETKRDEMACLAGIYATHREKAATIQRNITPFSCAGLSYPACTRLVDRQG